MSKSKAKPRFTPSRQCGHCGNHAVMRVVAEFNDLSVSNDDGFPINSGACYELLQCPACQNVELETHNYCSEFEEQNFDYATLYPASPKIPSGLPEPLKKEYAAALKVRSISANAYGVLMRRVLELVCEDRKATGNSTFLKLKDLATRGEIPSKLVKVADSLRVFGNVGAHATLGELTTKEVPILEDLTRAILEYVYAAPFLAEQAENALKKLRSRKAK